jgi:polysaccharide pyruvyl transferase CsaB
MKVVHLIGGGDVGGAKTHVLYLLRELGKHIDVKLISLRPGVFADDAKKMGIDIEVVKSGNIISDVRKVSRIIKDGKFDIIHSHGAKANMFSLASRRKSKIPTVTTVHSDYRLDYMHSFLKRISIGVLNTIALRFMGNYIAVSDNFRKMLTARNFDPEDIFILYNGMDFSETSVEYSREKLLEKYKLNIKENDVIVGIASRLYPVKSIDTIIRAAALVKEQNKNIKFIIGGDGEDKKKLMDLAENLGLKDTVFFVGWLDDPKELMSSVDISILTSISESFPYSILEGARFKKATISSNVGGIPDLITNGDNGLLFTPRDYRKLSELILELSSDRTKRVEMGEKIYDKAFQNFSTETMCKTQLEIYRDIIEKSARHNPDGKYYDTIISGYYGFRNIGDDALLMSIVNDLRKQKPDMKILILSKIPEDTALEHKVDSISRVNLLRIYKAMKKARSFIYGGGNLLQDNTSTRSLMFYLGMVWLAKKMKLKVMFYANGIGPLKKKINRLLTKKIMNKVDVITLREKLSYAELTHMDISKPKVMLTADSAFTVIDCMNGGSNEILNTLGIDPSLNYIGFSLRKYPGHEKLEHEDYENIIASLADHMAEKFNLIPVFIPMQHPDDLPVLENVSAKTKSNHIVIRQKMNVCDTYKVIGSMGMVIGMRLHALVFAAGAGVPMLGLVYDPKIEGFMEYINQPSAGDVRKLDLGKLKEQSEDIWNRRSEIRNQLGENYLVLKEKAGENAKVAFELISSNLPAR